MHGTAYFIVYIYLCTVLTALLSVCDMNLYVCSMHNTMTMTGGWGGGGRRRGREEEC